MSDYKKINTAEELFTSYEVSIQKKMHKADKAIKLIQTCAYNAYQKT